MGCNRESEGRGISDESYLKHHDIDKLISGQVSMFRVRFPDARMLLIDGNAGDGTAVKNDNGKFPNARILREFSRPTPKLLSDLAEAKNTELILCEKNEEKRECLRKLFPQAIIARSHRMAAQHTIGQRYDYVLWVSDPCGPSGHGVEHMREIAKYVLRSEFLVVLNMIGLRRIDGVREKIDPLERATHWTAEYAPMIDPHWWHRQLLKRQLLLTNLRKQSDGFHYRMMLIANHLSKGATSQKDIIEAIYTRSNWS